MDSGGTAQQPPTAFPLGPHLTKRPITLSLESNFSNGTVRAAIMWFKWQEYITFTCSSMTSNVRVLYVCLKW